MEGLRALKPAALKGLGLKIGQRNRLSRWLVRTAPISLRAGATAVPRVPWRPGAFPRPSGAPTQPQSLGRPPRLRAALPLKATSDDRKRIIRMWRAATGVFDNIAVTSPAQPDIHPFLVPAQDSPVSKWCVALHGRYRTQRATAAVLRADQKKTRGRSGASP